MGLHPGPRLPPAWPSVVRNRLLLLGPLVFSTACLLVLGAARAFARHPAVTSALAHGSFVLPAGTAWFDLSMFLLVAAAARTFVLGALVFPAACALMLGYLWLCAIAAARTFVLGTLALCAIAAVACAVVLGTVVLLAVAQACCFAWIGSSRGGLRPGSNVLRPRALCRRRALRALMPPPSSPVSRAPSFSPGGDV